VKHFLTFEYIVVLSVLPTWKILVFVFLLKLLLMYQCLVLDLQINTVLLLSEPMLPVGLVKILDIAIRVVSLNHIYNHLPKFLMFKAFVRNRNVLVYVVLSYVLISLHLCFWLFTSPLLLCFYPVLACNFILATGKHSSRWT
jgi:hypothetical protein